MRWNPDGSLSSPGASRAAALLPVYRWAFFEKNLSSPRSGVVIDKVTAGLNPADPATLAKGSVTTQGAAFGHGYDWQPL
jgi:hypothetical protein